jgi:Secretion system C-terminal sorting domain
VRVAIRYNGVYQGFGAPCTITTSPGAVRESEAINTNVFAVNAYPNPFAENFKLDINTTSAERVEVKVYDMIGKLIEVRDVNVSELTTQEVGDRYSSGVYNVIVTQGANVKTLRVIKR